MGSGSSKVHTELSLDYDHVSWRQIPRKELVRIERQARGKFRGRPLPKLYCPCGMICREANTSNDAYGINCQGVKFKYDEIGEVYWEPNTFLEEKHQLKTLLKQDERYLKKLNLTHQQVGKFMEKVISGEVSDPLWQLEVIETDEKEPWSPFQKKNETDELLATCQKCYVLTNILNNTSIDLNSVIVPLIKKNGFFGGSPLWRLSPVEIITFFGADEIAVVVPKENKNKNKHRNKIVPV